MSEPLKIGITADMIRKYAVGGVEMFVAGLLSALGKLPDQNEHYYVILREDDAEWVKPFLAANQEIVTRKIPQAYSPLAETLPSSPDQERPSLRRRFVKRMAKAVAPDLLPMVELISDQYARRVPTHTHEWPEKHVSDGFYEGLGCDVIHFAFQDYVICGARTVYTPHDLQHLHFPQNFAPKDIIYRETVQPTGCHFAQAITTSSQWIKNDIVKKYAASPDKIFVIPGAPASQAYRAPSEAEVKAVLKKYKLPKQFAFYPAVTWPHKNHATLIRAVAWLRDSRDLFVPLVCSGQKTDYFQELDDLIADLKLGDRVFFIGKVSNEDMRPLYHNAKAVVVPTLHEAASFPIFEAWSEGVAVACSRVTSLPEQVGDAAILFDALAVEQIGEAMARIFGDDKLREDLITRGRRRLDDFSWERTASAYRALYRQVGGIKLSREERYLLEHDWMSNSQKEHQAL